LCRVPSYLRPGLPKPTTSFIPIGELVNWWFGELVVW
jgi:hypothetical protein